MTLRLHFRNRMALLYGFLFPVIFLLSFYALYRHEQVPMLLHMGELLTVTVLGGACFGLPTTLVSERERGVWQRYRLTPVTLGTLVFSTILARYILLVAAGLLQLGLALIIGMTAPADPVALAIVFSLAAFAFIGIGLMIAALADTVPAVKPDWFNYTGIIHDVYMESTPLLSVVRAEALTPDLSGRVEVSAVVYNAATEALSGTLDFSISGTDPDAAARRASLRSSHST